MGIQDRDWYREETAKRSGMHYDAREARYSWRRNADRATAQTDELGEIRKPPPGRRTMVLPPEPPGGSWHWATQALVWLAVMGLLFVAFKVFERKRDEKLRLERQIAAQQAVIEQQRRQLEAARPKPKIDFFK